MLGIIAASEHPSKTKRITFKKVDCEYNHHSMLQKHIPVLKKISSYLQEFAKMLIVIKQKKGGLCKNNTEHIFLSL